MQKIHCPKCNQEYELDESIVGCSVQCAVCDAKFVAQLPDNLEDIQDITGDSETASAVGDADNKPVKCPHCNKENAAKTAYCIFCGKKLTAPTNCPFCNAALVNGAAFCPSCGERIDGNSDNKTPAKSSGLTKNIMARSGSFINGLIAYYRSLSKKGKIVFASVFSIALIILCIVIAKSASGDGVDKTTANKSSSSSYSNNSLSNKQADADAAALLLLMGAAAAQQQQQNTRQTQYDFSRKPQSMGCLSCSGKGYIMVNGYPLTCGQCGGKGRIEY